MSKVNIVHTLKSTRTEPRIKGKNSGAILIVTLITLSLVAFVAMQIGKFSFFDYSLASSTSLNISSKLEAKSAQNIFSKIAQKQLSYSQKDLLVLGEETELILNNVMGKQVVVEILDENSKFPINAFFNENLSVSGAQYLEDVFVRLIFLLLTKHDLVRNEHEANTMAKEILHSVLVWGGLGQMSKNGADWYAVQEPYYQPPKENFFSPEELRLIYCPLQEAEKKILLEGNNNVPGLLELVTVWQYGPINLTSAHPILLEAMYEKNYQVDEFIKEILDDRQDVSALDSQVNTSVTASNSLSTQERSLTDTGLSSSALSNFTLSNQTSSQLSQRWYGIIFTRYGVNIPPAEVVSDKSRLLQLRVRFGDEQRYFETFATGFVVSNGVNWYYQNTQ